MNQALATRLNPRQDERCRASIQTTQLCKRLNAFALGLPDPAGGNGRNSGQPFEMTDTQVRAALGLLRKTLPDLAVTQLSADEGSVSLLAAHLMAARAVSEQLQAEREPITISGRAEPVQAQVSLLDSPPPTE